MITDKKAPAKELSHIHTKILVPYIVSLLLICLVFLFSIYALKNKIEKSTAKATYHQMDKVFTLATAKRVQLFNLLTSQIQSNPQITKTWLNNEGVQPIQQRSEIESQLKPLFDRINKEYNVTHLYIHLPDRTNFLRIHEPSRFNDKINHNILLKAEQTKQTASGLKFDVNGALILTIVQPWTSKGKITGYIEMGSNINHMLASIENHLDKTTFAAIRADYLNNSIPSSNAKATQKNHQTGIMNSSLFISIEKDLPKNLYDGLQHITAKQLASGNELSTHSKSILLISIPFRDIDNKPMGQFLIHNDLSQKNIIPTELLGKTFIACLLIVSIFSLFFSIYSRKIQLWISNAYTFLKSENTEMHKNETALRNIQQQLNSTIQDKNQDLVASTAKLKDELNLRAEIESALLSSESKYHALFECSADAMLILDDNAITDCNAAAVTMFKYPAKDDLLSFKPSQISPEKQANGTLSEIAANEMVVIAFNKGSHRFEWNHKKADGVIFPVEVLLTVVALQDKKILHAVCRDITDRKSAEEQAHYQAYYDAVTQLPNRRLMIDRLQQAINHCNRHNHYSALFIIDLDRFKTINDSLGHSAGDILLKQVADRMTQHLREEDTISRVGADVFSILIQQLENEQHSYISSAEHISQDISTIFKLPFTVNNHDFHFKPSIGIAIFSTNEETPEDIIKHADAAMHCAKKRGPSSFEFYLPSMEEAVIHRLNIEKDLHKAMQNEELFLHYQPQYDGDRNIIGVEALLRWKHPTKGNISPVEFIPVAEDTGLIIPIGEWVLKQSILDIQKINNQLPDDKKIRVSVNVSTIQFRQKNFTSNIIDIVNSCGSNIDFLILEITESIAIENIQHTISKINELKRQKIRFSIDDFGTGHSSLRYLQQLPVAELKIDRSFVMDLETNENDMLLVRSIITLALQFGLEVVAEGVETQTQMNFLKANHCQLYQGFLLSRPLPLAELNNLFLPSAKNLDNRLENNAS